MPGSPWTEEQLARIGQLGAEHGINQGPLVEILGLLADESIVLPGPGLRQALSIEADARLRLAPLAASRASGVSVFVVSLADSSDRVVTVEAVAGSIEEARALAGHPDEQGWQGGLPGRWWLDEDERGWSIVEMEMAMAAEIAAEARTVALPVVVEAESAEDQAERVDRLREVVESVGEDG